METEDYLTVQQIAAEWNLKEDTVRRAIQRKRVSTQEIFGRRVVKREDWIAYRETAKRGRVQGFKPKKAGETDHRGQTSEKEHTTDG